jgi:hypothetical protein
MAENKTVQVSSLIGFRDGYCDANYLNIANGSNIQDPNTSSSKLDDLIEQRKIEK